MTAETQTIRELADAEAARAEAEDTDDDDEAAADEESKPPTEPEPEPEQPGEPAPEPPTQAQLEKMMDKLSKEDERHAKRYAEVLGDQFAMMMPCPRCLESGHIYPPEVAPVDPDQLAAVDASLGRDVMPELLQAKDAERCQDCDGRGMVKTGAQNETGAAKVCTPCGGQGWVTPSGNAPSGTATVTLHPLENGNPDDADATPMPDRWGRPIGHPHWGQDPATIGV
jgi:hypothetical protein